MLTEYDVFQACEDLLAAGEIAGLVAIRKKLGRGSYSTIAKHLKAWELSKVQAQIRSESGFDQAIQKAISDIAPTLYQAIKDSEIKSLRVERDKLSELLGQKESTLQELSKMVDSLQSSNVFLEQDRAQAKLTLERNLKTISDQEKLIKSYQRTNDELSIRNEEQARTLDHLKAVLSQYRERFGEV